MSEKFYKLVDGILWADIEAPDLKDYLAINPQYHDTERYKQKLAEYNSRPHFPLSGTLEGKERYELGEDFKIKYTCGCDKATFGKAICPFCHKQTEPTAFPIAQPVEGEKEGNRQMFEFHLRQNVHDIVQGVIYPEIAISKILYVFDKINKGEGSQRSVATTDQSGNEKLDTKKETELYRWIKAGQRLPELNTSVNIKFDDCPYAGKFEKKPHARKPHFTDGDFDIFYDQFDRIEWLEKITPDTK